MDNRIRLILSLGAGAGLALMVGGAALAGAPTQSGDRTASSVGVSLAADSEDFADVEAQPETAPVATEDAKTEALREAAEGQREMAENAAEGAESDVSEKAEDTNANERNDVEKAEHAPAVVSAQPASATSAQATHTESKDRADDQGKNDDRGHGDDHGDHVGG